MFIIVEGPKCCGKTTLCNRLADAMHAEIIHFPTGSSLGKLAMKTLESGDYNTAQDLMEKDIDQTLSSLDPNKLWILDRSFISNTVYRQTEHLILKDKYSEILDNSMLIILIASTENLESWIKLRVEKPLNQVEKDKLSWSNERFHKVAKLLGCVELKQIDKFKVGKWFIRRS